MRTLKHWGPVLVGVALVAAMSWATITTSSSAPACVGAQCLVGTYPTAVADPIDGGTPTARIEYGYGAMTSGSLAVTFQHAFAVAPVCTCTHTDTTNTNPCTIHVAATTTAVTFAVASGGTDRVTWLCIGDK